MSEGGQKTTDRRVDEERGGVPSHYSSTYNEIYFRETSLENQKD